MLLLFSSIGGRIVDTVDDGAPLSFFPSHVHWPNALMRDRQWEWELMGRTISGGKTLAGPMPIARLDGGGLWSATLGDVQVSTADQVRAFRALAAMLDGGATPVVLAARDERIFPAPVFDGVRTTAALSSAHDDDALFSDGSSYTSDVVRAAVFADADLRATTMQIRIAIGSALRGGEYFSIQHETLSHRLYRIGSVTTEADVATVTIRPPLREAVAANTRVEFDYPKCTMRLATPDAMDLSLTRRIHGQATVKFIESFPPWL